MLGQVSRTLLGELGAGEDLVTIQDLEAGGDGHQPVQHQLAFGLLDPGWEDGEFASGHRQHPIPWVA